jgi:hypothetical protein
MASYREMDAVGRDRGRFVMMAKQCLLFPLNVWERNFCESLIAEPPERLSTRQAETLFEIRDEYELHSKLHGGFSVVTLIQRVYEARLDLDEGDEEWITEIWNRRPVVDRLRRRDLGRLRRCSIEIGAIEPYMDVA